MDCLPKDLSPVVRLLLLILLGASLQVAAQEGVNEADLKAAFIYNFTKYVEWPNDVLGSPDKPFVIGVVGDRALAAAFEQSLSAKKAHGHPITVRLVENSVGGTEATILFFPENQSRRIGQFADVLRGRAVLTIGESEQFLDYGGVINLFFEDKQLRFQVNAAAADDAGLAISSKLLRLAKRVSRGGGK